MIKQGAPRTRALRLIALALCLTLSACESLNKLGEGFGNMGDKALETIGFKKPELPAVPELPELAKPARRISLRIAASDSLNVDAAGRSLSLVVRVYKLRSAATFLNAPAETFGNAAKEKEALGDEMIESRELVLLPGQQQQISERWARDASYVGVVALFRAPAPQRWRYAFELESLPSDAGLVLGAHACGMSVASGEPVGVSAAARELSTALCTAY